MGISADYWSHILAVEDDKLMLRSGTGSNHNQAILSPHTPDQQLFATPLAGRYLAKLRLSFGGTP